MSKWQENYTIAVAAADKLIHDFALTKPDHIKLDLIASDRNVFIKEGDVKGSSARLVCQGDYGLITIDNKIKEEGQKRFAIVHELGHFLLHKKLNHLHQCDANMMLNWYKKRKEEPESNAFASALLMPGQMFSQYCKGSSPSFKKISELAHIFNTSFTSTALKHVDCVSFPCVLIVIEDKKVKWFHSNENFHYRIISPGEAISKNSCAIDFYENGTIATDPEPVIGSAWLENWRSGKEILLNEQMRAFPNYGFVLSLLWPNAY